MVSGRRTPKAIEAAGPFHARLPLLAARVAILLLIVVILVLVPRLVVLQAIRPIRIESKISPAPNAVPARARRRSRRAPPRPRRRRPLGSSRASRRLRRSRGDSSPRPLSALPKPLDIAVQFPVELPMLRLLNPNPKLPGVIEGRLKQIHRSRQRRRFIHINLGVEPLNRINSRPLALQPRHALILRLLGAIENLKSQPLPIQSISEEPRQVLVMLVIWRHQVKTLLRLLDNVIHSLLHILIEQELRRPTLIPNAGCRLPERNQSSPPMPLLDRIPSPPPTSPQQGRRAGRPPTYRSILRSSRTSTLYSASYSAGISTWRDNSTCLCVRVDSLIASPTSSVAIPHAPL